MLKIDKFYSNRGSQCTICEVKCRNCKSFLLTYQKDGPPHRMFRKIYPDKILELGLAKLRKTVISCTGCKRSFGAIFTCTNHGENRIAYKVDRSRIVKKVVQKG